MPNVTIICFISSLLCYGLGFSRILALKNAIIENIGYDFNIIVSITTTYFVLAIFFAVIGFLSYTSTKKLNKKRSKVINMDFRGNPEQEQEIA